MSFESGSISFRAYFLPREWPQDALERFSAHAAPPLKTLKEGEIHGWVGGRHLLDLPITEDNATFASFLRLSLMQAERKIPASLFRAECLMEEYLWMRAEQKPFVDRLTRARIRKEVSDRLMPTMPPTLRGIPIVREESAGLLFTGALSERQGDALVSSLRGTLGLDFIPVTFETLAAQRSKARVRNWAAASYTPDLADGDSPATPAEDFLTWLWYYSEAEGGLFDLDGQGPVGVALDGPVLFTAEGEQAAQEAALRKGGAPLASAEARTALRGGKKLRRAKLTMAQNPRSWTCTFDVVDFVFRGLKVTEPEERMDAASLFLNRMNELTSFFGMIGSLVERFVALRESPKQWAALQPKIQAWTAGAPAPSKAGKGAWRAEES